MGTDHGFDDLVPLGSGPMATVYAGTRTDTGEAVALKVLDEKVSKRTRNEVERELARLRPLRDRAPVLVADALEELEGGRTALRMELCSQSLTELITTDGPLSVPDALALGRALASALRAAHEAGIVHGGVTPGNVLFRPSGEPVLADFGLVLRRAFPREPGPGVDFLAPETLRDGTVDERSDLYGLGAVLHLALSGTSPHPAVLGEEPDERVLRVLGTPAPRLARPDLPNALAEVVGALLAKDPAIRPGGIAVVVGWLDAMAARVTPDAPPTPAPAPDPSGFDDFASAPRSVPRPKGDPVFVSAPRPAESKLRHALPLLGGAAGIFLLVAAGVALLRSDPPVLEALPTDVPAASAQPPTSAKAVQLELLEPVDRTDHVELAWRSSEELEFVVVVAAEGDQEAKTFRAQHNRTLSVDVDPTRQYCFLVQGTDGTAVYASAPKSLRAAKCKL